MDELCKALKINIAGPVKKTALAQMDRQIRSWKIVMPDVEPLVLDFGLGNFAKTGLIEYWITNEKKGGYCAKYLFLFDDQTCPAHHHKEKLETFFIVHGEVEMRIGSKRRRMISGDVLLVKCGQIHCFKGLGNALILEISQPCKVNDNYFENELVPYGNSYKLRK